MAPAELEVTVGRIGPNAVTRVVEVLGERLGAARTASILDGVGLGAYVGAPPTQMVDENEVIRLHRSLRVALGPAAAREVARQAGVRTADYLLAHRIPRAAQTLLRWLPSVAASRLLLAAIARHAWTFSGSGVFRVVRGEPVRVSITNNPLCRGAIEDAPQCDFYAATFERLFRVLVHRHATVREIACEANGAAACVFEIGWTDRHSVGA